MIRKYADTDTDQIVEIWHQASALAHPFLERGFVEQERSNLINLYLPNAETWVYEVQNQAIAFISMLENEIGGLFVLPDRQARGVGTMLVDFVRETHRELEVEVFEQNRIGRSFYAKYGFVQEKRYFHQDSKCEMLRLVYRP